MAIFFRGKAYSAKKRFFDGTHRIQSPEETWDKIAPLAPKIGVTRIANITGLDRIGIPVTLAIRPGTRTLSVSSGKGLSLIAAQVSGLMEACEIFCAEEKVLPSVTLSYNELIKSSIAPSISDLRLSSNALFHPDLPDRWTLGWDLFEQKEIAIPLDMVILDFRINANGRVPTPFFYQSSNGLASGCHFLEAVLAAIYEAIERDATTCSHYAHSYGAPIQKVILETITFPRVREVLETFRKAEIQAALYDYSVDTKVPTFKALICDMRMRHTSKCGGYGSHLDPEIAMLRALTEAAQSRAIHISGSRDDMYLASRFLSKKTDSAKNYAAFNTEPCDLDATCYRSEACTTLEEEIELLMHKLKEAGLHQLIVFDMSLDQFDVSVARVIIPGLEGYRSGNYQPGTRAQKIIAELKERNHCSFVPQKEAFHLPAGGS